MNTEDNSDIEISLDEEDSELAMLPPIEKVNAETDMDSDALDDMNNGLVHHLWRCLLNSACGVSLFDKEINKNLCNALNPPNRKSRKSAARYWKKRA